MIGTKLVDRYEIVGELGRGGMGVVYRARDPILNRDVAVKLVPPMLLTAQSEERFQREARLVAQMNHPGIVSIFDIGRHEGSLFYLMPVVDGVNLRTFLHQQPRSIGEVIEITIQVADALEYSHARGVIHRDVKPENIMIAAASVSTPRVCVMDFGLAKASTENRLTKTGTLVGTMAYFSPEQVVSKEIDHRSDIYSLGTIVYEALSGEPPFTGEVQSILYRIVHEHPRSLRSIGIDISEELEEIVLRCLAKDPARRYQSAAELAEALRRCHANLEESERARSVVLSAVLTAQVQRPAASPFVGREREFAELQRRLNSASDGECQFAVIGGEPGVGKSRLLEELANLAKAKKIRVLHGRFVEQNRAFSYQGFCELIQDYFRSRDVSGSSGEQIDFSDLATDLIALFPVLGEVSAIRSAASTDQKPLASGETKRAEDRMYVFELLARTVARMAGGKPLLVILENLHGAEMSLDALQYVIQRLSPTPTLIAGTYRQTEIDRGHPLVRFLDTFVDDPRFSSTILGPFSASEHRKFVESIVGSSNLSSGLAERLFTATEGNPFFTKELVRSLLDSGGMAKDESGSWSLSRAMAIGSDSLPATIQQAVERRVERLPEEMREILSIASVLGRSFEFEDLEYLAEEKSLDKLVDRLIEEGLIEEERESRGDRLAFSSGIIRDVLYGAISRRRRRSLHRKYAERLEKRNTGRLERVYPQLVHHFSEGDVADKTVEYGMKQTRKSLESFSADEAIHVVKIVLEFLKDRETEADPSLEGEAHLLLAESYTLQGSIEGSLREAEQAIRIFEREKRHDRAAAATLLAAETAWQGRRVDETTRWLSQGPAAARLAGDTERLGKFLSLSATVANLRGEYAKAKQYLDEVEELRAGLVKTTADELIPQGGRLVVALANPATAVDPAQINTDEDSEVLALAFETLVTSDEQGHLVPNLCERWDVRDGGRRLRLTTREGVFFEDGSPLTAADVKSSLERAIRTRVEIPPALNVIRGASAYQSGESSELEGVRVLSRNSLEIETVEPLPIYPALLTDPIVAIARVSEEHGRVMGTGQFRVAASETTSMRLERNPQSWRPSRPAVDEIEFRLFPTASEIAASFRGGEVDLARDLLPGDLEEILRDSRHRARLVEAPKKNTYFILFNTSTPLGGNEQARQALSGFLRTHELVWRTLGRQAQPAAGLIPPSIFGHDPGRKRAPLGREDAIAQLLEAGAPNATIRASLHPLMQDRYRSLTRAVFDSWRELGARVSVDTPTIKEYLDSFKNNQEIDLIIGRWNSDYDDPDNFTYGLFHSDTGIFSRFFSSREADAILEEARAEIRPENRESLYRKFENLLISSGIFIPLFHEIDYRLVSAKVRGIKFRSHRPYVNYAELGKAELSSSAPAAQKMSGGVIHVPLLEDFRELDPIAHKSADQAEVMLNIFDTLTRCGEGARILPWLASEYAAEDGGRRYRFVLRENVRFHDGRRLTARDVRYSWERLLSSSKSVYQRLLLPMRGAKNIVDGETDDLEGFRIVSSREFIVHLEQPLSFFPALLCNAASSIIQEGTTQLSGSWRDGFTGTGPFRLVQFEPGQRVELERNPSYWRDGLPRSDRLIFHLGVEPAEAKSDLESGRFSLAGGLFPSDVDSLRHNTDLAPGYREMPRLCIYFAAFNRNSGPLRDLELRKRLFSGIDTAGLVRRTLGRLAVPASGIIPPGLLGYSPTRESTVSSAVAERQTSEIELTASVHPLFFGQYSAFARDLSAVLRERGVKLRILNKTMQDYLELNESGTGDVIVGRWVGDYPDSDTFTYGVLNSAGGMIGRQCGSADLDKLIERGRSEIDPDARHAIYREIEETLRREVVMAPLFYEHTYRFGRPELSGLTLKIAQPEVAYEELSIKA